MHGGKTERKKIKDSIKPYYFQPNVQDKKKL
jgi:hypothetical protein